MKIYDISRGIFTTALYPGTLPPQLHRLSDCLQGDVYTLSQLTFDLHTGTHVDAPAHFLPGAATIEALSLDRFVGDCSVVSLQKAAWNQQKIFPKLLLKQDGEYLTERAGKELIAAGVHLIGTDALSLAAPDEEELIHSLLLSAGVVLLENLELSAIPEGDYFLSAPPVKIEGAEAAPVRAILIDFSD